MTRKPYLLILLFALAPFLSACSSIISATSDGPIQEDYGQRTWGSALDDRFIETKARVNLDKASTRLEQADIDVTSYNGVVLLAGQVADEDLKTLAGEVVRKIRKVRRVHNELEISGKISNFSNVNDSWISSKIRTKMLVSTAIQSSRIVVITENGTVYLMGLVTRDEGRRSANIAAETGGVRKVVQIFEYIE